MKKIAENETEKIKKILNNPMIKKKLTKPEIKIANLKAQKALENPPNVKTDGLVDVLDWIERYLLILKGK